MGSPPSRPRMRSSTTRWARVWRKKDMCGHRNLPRLPGKGMSSARAREHGEMLRLASEVNEHSIGYAGWQVAAAASACVLVSFASLFVYTFAIFLKPLVAD